MLRPWNIGEVTYLAIYSHVNLLFYGLKSRFESLFRLVAP